MQKALSSNDDTLVKESSFLTVFPLEKDHTGHVVGEVLSVLHRHIYFARLLFRGYNKSSSVA